MIGINSCAHELGYDSNLMTFEPDLWRDDAIMIDACSPDNITSTIGDPVPTDIKPPLEVVMNSEPIGYLAHNAMHHLVAHPAQERRGRNDLLVL